MRRATFSLDHGVVSTVRERASPDLHTISRPRGALAPANLVLAGNDGLNIHIDPDMWQVEGMALGEIGG